jgi:cation diffusion facilitator CzcD-associated flavoprotein CzcO
VTGGGVAIVGAGPYGLSLAAHLAARNIKHRIFGPPMQFWSQIAAAGGERYLKSYCFGTNISTPAPGYSFADYCAPRGLETFEPCSIADFAAYGLWFQQNNVPWVESVEVAKVDRKPDGFAITLDTGERFAAERVVVATGLSCFADVPRVLASLPAARVTHTSRIAEFASFNGRSVAVIGGGQSALEAAALLREAGAQPQLLVRENAIAWNSRIAKERNLWRKLRSPVSGLGTGPKAWALARFPGAMHRIPDALRTRFVKSHLPAEGAWWLRARVEDQLPISLGTSVVGAGEAGDQVALKLHIAKDGSERKLIVDHVIAGSGYVIDVDRLDFLASNLRGDIQRLEGAPKLSAAFESSAPGLHFIGPASAMSFGPLFRFVVGAEYAARVILAHLASEATLGM